MNVTMADFIDSVLLSGTVVLSFSDLMIGSNDNLQTLDIEGDHSTRSTQVTVMTWLRWPQQKGYTPWQSFIKYVHLNQNKPN